MELIDDNDIELLKSNLKAVSGMPETPTIYHQAKYLVDGGMFLCYHSDIQEFLETLNINPKNKTFTNQQSWDLYKHLIAKAIEKIVK